MSQHDVHMLPFVDFFGYLFLLYWPVVGLLGAMGCYETNCALQDPVTDTWSVRWKIR